MRHLAITSGLFIVLSRFSLSVVVAVAATLPVAVGLVHVACGVAKDRRCRLRLLLLLLTAGLVVAVNGFEAFAGDGEKGAVFDRLSDERHR